MNTLVFDIETVPDTDLGRRLYHLQDLTDEQVGQIMFTRRAPETAAISCRMSNTGSWQSRW